MATQRRRRTDRQRPQPSPLGLPSAEQILVLVGEPTSDEIARRAYELYEQRGCAHGNDWKDWFQAEQEVKVRKLGAVAVGV